MRTFSERSCASTEKEVRQAHANRRPVRLLPARLSGLFIPVLAARDIRAEPPAKRDYGSSERDGANGDRPYQQACGGNREAGSRARGRRNKGLALLCLALTGCGLAHPKTVYLTRNCVTKQEYEKFAKGEPPKVHDQLTGQGDADTRPLAGSALELRGWGHAMLQTLRICSDEKQAGDLINDKLSSK